ncbi:MAG TPA: type II toxin-antitoxin system PemK/MazF family toxin [Acidimicrobiales bacterium]|nr:type II toxin-antitoxin system PemK/MazF family toxin [Acidimicrobiales bacterium]
MQRAEVWWAAWPPGQRHPVLVLSWDAGRGRRTQVTLAEVTTTVRGHAQEVSLGPTDGMPRACVANLDRLVTIPGSLLARRITTLTAGRMAEVERAIHLAMGIRLPCRVT